MTSREKSDDIIKIVTSTKQVNVSKDRIYRSTFLPKDKAVSSLLAKLDRGLQRPLSPPRTTQQLFYTTLGRVKEN